LHLKFTYLFLDFLWYLILAISSGICWRIDRCLDCKESTICTFTAASHTIKYDSDFRFLLMRPKVPHYRSNRRKESNHQV
jgi:hypothetical protein